MHSYYSYLLASLAQHPSGKVIKTHTYTNNYIFTNIFLLFNINIISRSFGIVLGLLCSDNTIALSFCAVITPYNSHRRCLVMVYCLVMKYKCCAVFVYKLWLDQGCVLTAGLSVVYCRVMLSAGLRPLFAPPHWSVSKRKLTWVARIKTGPLARGSSFGRNCSSLQQQFKSLLSLSTPLLLKFFWTVWLASQRRDRHLFEVCRGIYVSMLYTWYPPSPCCSCSQLILSLSAVTSVSTSSYSLLNRLVGS